MSTSLRNATTGPTLAPSPPIGELSSAGWFDLQRRNRDQNTLEGFDLDVGTLDGRVARRITTRYGPLTPSGRYRGALPVAAGPFGDVVLYAYWDGERSEVHAVSVTSGEDVLVTRREEIVHAVTYQPSTRSVIVNLRDSGTRADLGVLRFPMESPGSEQELLPATPTDPAAQRVLTRLWVTPDSERLVVLDCPVTCSATIIELSGATVLETFDVEAGLDIVGVTDAAIVAVFGCMPPCAGTTYDLASGVRSPIGTFCAAGALADAAGAADATFLVSDRPVEGDCLRGPYRIGRADLATGLEAIVTTRPDRQRTIVSMDGSQGATTPDGWVLIGPDGRLVDPDVERSLEPWLIRLSDGLVQRLPAIPGRRPG